MLQQQKIKCILFELYFQYANVVPVHLYYSYLYNSVYALGICIFDWSQRRKLRIDVVLVAYV